MCRNIRPLFNFDPPATKNEIEGAALQFVRKVSGFTTPSRANEAAFNRAIADISKVTRVLLDSLMTRAQPRDREAERLRAQARRSAPFLGEHRDA